MRPDEIAQKIQPFELLPSQELTAGRPIIARLIGRRFEQLYEGRFEKPYDPLLGKMLVKTLAHLCATLGATYGYAERNELSLFAISNGGDARRLVSRLGGEASAKLSLLLGDVATFDARLYEFPSLDLVFDYFSWRRGESQQAALDTYSTHTLVSTGADPDAVPRILEGLATDEKIELLRQNSLDFTQVPAWQRQGVGVYVARDTTTGPQLVVDLQLPPEEGYSAYLQRLVA